MDVKKLTTLAVLSAIAYILMVLLHFPLIPSAPFLWFDPKDVIIAIGGFIYGPLASLGMATVVGLLEMITVTETGVIGLAMNVISSAAFSCTAAYIYQKRHRISNAVIGLISGSLLATASMVLWNYLLTPIYMGIERDVVAGMLLPVFLPFNLIKYSIITSITLLLYKPVVTGLRAANLIPAARTADGDTPNYKYLWIFAGVAAVVIFFAWFIATGRLGA